MNGYEWTEWLARACEADERSEAFSAPQDPQEASPTPAALRSRLRGLNRALRLPGDLWVDRMRDDDVLEIEDLFSDDPEVEERRIFENGVKLAHTIRMLRWRRDDAPRRGSVEFDRGPTGRKITWHRGCRDAKHMDGKMLLRDFNVPTASIPDYGPEDDAALEAYCFAVWENEGGRERGSATSD